MQRARSAAPARAGESPAPGRRGEAASAAPAEHGAATEQLGALMALLGPRYKTVSRELLLEQAAVSERRSRRRRGTAAPEAESLTDAGGRLWALADTSAPAAQETQTSQPTADEREFRDWALALLREDALDADARRHADAEGACASACRVAAAVAPAAVRGGTAAARAPPRLQAADGAVSAVDVGRPARHAVAAAPAAAEAQGSATAAAGPPRVARNASLVQKTWTQRRNSECRNAMIKQQLLTQDLIKIQARAQALSEGLETMSSALIGPAVKRQPVVLPLSALGKRPPLPMASGGFQKLFARLSDRLAVAPILARDAPRPPSPRACSRWAPGPFAGAPFARRGAPLKQPPPPSFRLRGAPFARSHPDLWALQRRSAARPPAPRQRTGLCCKGGHVHPRGRHVPATVPRGAERSVPGPFVAPGPVLGAPACSRSAAPGRATIMRLRLSTPWASF
ncbi:unnamed protein product [Prorocentrum cordatum]|uniref:Uncharacterized protein n=1 Tax=Prorocentrum cordatum TaxID=2364126 RepID=A0ABN9TE58_9DINO|nr:unnamed protein product [Polarella glacialis]